MKSFPRHLLVRLFSACIACAAASMSASAPTAPASRLVIANQFEHTVLVVDPADHKVLFTVGVDINGHELAVSPDHHFAYVPIYGNSGVGKPGTDGRTIQVVDIRAGFAVSVIDLGKAVRPHCAKFAPNGGTGQRRLRC